MPWDPLASIRSPSYPVRGDEAEALITESPQPQVWVRKISAFRSRFRSRPQSDQPPNSAPSSARTSRLRPLRPTLPPPIRRSATTPA